MDERDRAAVKMFISEVRSTLEAVESSGIMLCARPYVEVDDCAYIKVSKVPDILERVFSVKYPPLSDVEST